MFRKLFCVIFFLNFINNCFSEDQNVTCSDGRTCFIIETFEEHCEIYIGSECFPPCDLKKCSIKIENNIFCQRYDCTLPPPKPTSDVVKYTLLGAFSSWCSSCLIFIFWKCFKKIFRRNNVQVISMDDETGLLNEQYVSESEGDAYSRPIIRGQSTSAAASADYSPSAPTAFSDFTPPIGGSSAVQQPPLLTQSMVNLPTDSGSRDIATPRSQSMPDDLKRITTRSISKKKFQPSLEQIEEKTKKVNYLFFLGSIFAGVFFQIFYCDEIY